MTQTRQTVLASASRKTAIARCVVMPGSGIVRVNGKRLDAIENKYVRLLISEPILLIGDLAKKVNIKIKIRGGGIISQAYAARCAIARSIVRYFKDPEIEKLYKWYDRYLLIEDTRQKEMKKAGGPGARARYQTSYR